MHYNILNMPSIWTWKGYLSSSPDVRPCPRTSGQDKTVRGRPPRQDSLIINKTLFDK